MRRRPANVVDAIILRLVIVFADSDSSLKAAYCLRGSSEKSFSSSFSRSCAERDGPPGFGDGPSFNSPEREVAPPWVDGGTGAARRSSSKPLPRSSAGTCIEVSPHLVRCRQTTLIFWQLVVCTGESFAGVGIAAGIVGRIVEPIETEVLHVEPRGPRHRWVRAGVLAHGHVRHGCAVASP